MAHFFKKKENALRRSKELYLAGKKRLGIEILNSVLHARRHKQWTSTHEDIMKQYLLICVDLREKQFAKDGLYQYRNLCQREAPASLEVVANYLMDLAEQRCEIARLESGNRVKMSELNAESDGLAEDVMLSGIVADGEAHRAERELLVPWVRFLWESYRSVLEVTKGNNKLIEVYHSTIARAYKFCIEYVRTFEIRKLNEMVRKHLVDHEKYYEADLASGKKPFLIPLDADTYERHLESRFIALDAATKIKQWNQAYQLVEEIHGIMAKVDRPIRPKMMADYYKSLSDMFLVSRSYLFHAYAWLKFYNLNEKSNQSLTEAELTRMASALTLSALAVPVVKKNDSVSSYANDEADRKKRMSSLLGYSFNPNRETLIDHISSMGMLEHCEPWVKDLFSLLEKEFRPHDLVEVAAQHLERMRGEGAESIFSGYVSGIAELVIIRLCQQLGKVYRTLTLDELKRRLSKLSIPFSEVERIILCAVRRHYLTVRIDYRDNCLRFETGNLEVERTQVHLTQLGSNLKRVTDSLAGHDRAATNAEKKARLVAHMRSTVERDRSDNLTRKVLIEKMKEDREKRQLEEKRRRVYEQKLLEREAKIKERERLAQEKARREEEREARKKAQEDFKRKRELAQKMNLVMDDKELNEKTGDELIQQRQAEEIARQRKMQNKMRAQSNHVDYFCRAIRENERSILTQHIKTKMDAEEKAFLEEEERSRQKHKADWEKDIKEKKRTSRMLSFCGSYIEKLHGIRRERLTSERERLVLLAQLNKRKAKLERAKKRNLEAKQRVEAERLRQEQLKIQQEEEEIQRQEDERRKEDEEGGWRRASADPRNRARDRQREEQRRQPPMDNRDDRQRGSGEMDRYSARGGARSGGGGAGSVYRAPGRRGGDNSGGYGGNQGGGRFGSSRGQSGFDRQQQSGDRYRPPGRSEDRRSNGRWR